MGDSGRFGGGVVSPYLFCLIPAKAGMRACFWVLVVRCIIAGIMRENFWGKIKNLWHKAKVSWSWKAVRQSVIASLRRKVAPFWQIPLRLGKKIWHKAKAWPWKAVRQSVIASLQRKVALFWQIPLRLGKKIWHEIALLLQIPLGWLVMLLVFALLSVMFDVDNGAFAYLLGTGFKNDTITYIGLGLGGALAAVGAVALNQRAVAMADNNRLVEKGHIDERLKAAVQSLGHTELSVRIAAFYQFYHLAEGNSDMKLRRSILDILCAHLRQMTIKTIYRSVDGKHRPNEECQCLLNIIFRNLEDVRAKNIFSGIYKDLKGAYLVGADLRCANAENTSFSGAILRRAQFDFSDLQGAHFANANMKKASFVRANMRKSRFSLRNYPKAANVDAAIFSYANLCGVDMSRVDGHKAIGLETAEVDKTTKAPWGYYPFYTDAGDHWLLVKGSPP